MRQHKAGGILPLLVSGVFLAACSTTTPTTSVTPGMAVRAPGATGSAMVRCERIVWTLPPSGSRKVSFSS